MAQNKSITILETEVKPGENAIIRLPIGSLPTGTPIKIPIYIFNGKEKGPTALFQGGLHGDEINGVEICKRLLMSKNLKEIRKGAVLVIPLLNVFGFIHFSRDVTKGKDANRSFPGTKTGSLASRIAYYHTHEILSKIDFGVDFHTGGDMRENFPQIRYTPNNPESKLLATIFNAPFQFESNLIKKSFRSIAASKDIPIIVFEGGETMRFDERAINEGLNGVYRLLNHYDMISDLSTLPVNNSIELTYNKWVRAKKAGIFTTYIQNGAKVEKNHIIGSITDAYGSRNLMIKSPMNGFVFCINNHPLVSQGDAIFRIGS